MGREQDQQGSDGARLQRLVQRSNDPGVLWTPEHADAPTPLVLIGHGGNGHKRETHLMALARRFARHNQIASATIDGPVHGDRKPVGVDDGSSAERRRRLIGERVTDEMVEDWKATLDALHKHPQVGMGGVGYWGDQWEPCSGCRWLPPSRESKLPCWA